MKFIFKLIARIFLALTKSYRERPSKEEVNHETSEVILRKLWTIKDESEDNDGETRSQ